jgi:uncharacterized protein VirK/YbjX
MTNIEVSDKAVKAALAELERWGIKPSYLLSAVQDALQAAFNAQAVYDVETQRQDMIRYHSRSTVQMHADVANAYQRSFDV